MPSNPKRGRQGLSGLLDVVATLRKSCPWDRKQTLRSTRPLVLNETFELDEALRSGNAADIAEELGDYLFMGLFLADVARAEAGVELDQVCRGIVTKLKQRHPHIYGSVKVRGAADVLANWEKIKQKHKQAGLLSSVPRSLPALHQAQLIQERCRRVGFDWDDPARVLDKVEEEIRELRHELGQKRRKRARVEDELGDLLFVLVNLCRHLGVDAEGTLKDASAKFTRRFNHIEDHFRARGQDLAKVSLDDMEAVWRQAKRLKSPGRGKRATPRRG
jgi:MazG family protein